MLCDVVRGRRWAHAPVIAWVSISMHACDPVPIVMGLRLAALRAAGAPLLSADLNETTARKANKNRLIRDSSGID